MSTPFGNLAKPTIRYCESNLSGWVAQPANAGSSLLISLAGVYILTRKRNNYSLYLGIIAVILGLASFFYYASDTFIGQLADLGSMYLLASLLIVAALRRFKLSQNANLAILVIGAGASLMITAIVRTVASFNIGIPIFAILLAVAVYMELKSAKIEKLKLKFFWLTFVAFAIGYLFWWLDYKKIWCSSSTVHYVNGHAVWHFFNAVALILLDRYYSQVSKPEKSTI
jgi:Ceramidase